MLDATATPTTLAPITALPHAKGDRVDALLADAAAALQAARLRVAGLIQSAWPGRAC